MTITSTTDVLVTAATCMAFSAVIASLALATTYVFGAVIAPALELVAAYSPII